MRPLQLDETRTDVDELRIVTAAAAEALTAPARRAAAITYLRQRGIDAGTLPESWPLGYAPPGWTRLVDTLAPRFSEQALLDAGVAQRSSRGTLIDTFRDRVIFPVRDHADQVAGFIGRDTSGDANAPKYLNTRRTPLFDKSTLLYGLHEGLTANPSARRIVVVEGSLDVLAIAARARVVSDTGGLLPVAPSGTAFTTAHARRVTAAARLAGTSVVVALDADHAGRTAALTAGERLRGAGLDVRVAVLPEGCDPADYLAQPSGTLDTFRDTHTLPLLTVQVRHAIAAQGDRMQWVEGRIAAARAIAATLATYPVEHTARQLGWISHVLDIDPGVFTLEVADAYRDARPASERPVIVSRERGQGRRSRSVLRPAEIIGMGTTARRRQDHDVVSP